MAIHVSIYHKTEYQYDRLVSLSPHIVRLRPAAHTRTPIHSYSLKITPEEHFINWQQDPYGNYLARLAFPVNANEAESRRIARFRDIGHTPGKFEAPKEETSRDYPYTLDLRKQSPC